MINLNHSWTIQQNNDLAHLENVNKIPMTKGQIYGKTNLCSIKLFTLLPWDKSIKTNNIPAWIYYIEKRSWLFTDAKQ